MLFFVRQTPSGTPARSGLEESFTSGRPNDLGDDELDRADAHEEDTEGGLRVGLHFPEARVALISGNTVTVTGFLTGSARALAASTPAGLSPGGSPRGTPRSRGRSGRSSRRCGRGASGSGRAPGTPPDGPPGRGGRDPSGRARGAAGARLPGGARGP